MPRRHLRTWALWLLPLIAARAFLPVGFMLSFQAGSADLVFCPGQTPGIVAMHEHAAASGGHVHHLDHASTGVHASHEAGKGSGVEPPCIFGVAAVAISHDIPHLAGPVPSADVHQLLREAVFHPGLGPVRADRIRGPPVLS